MTNQQNERPNRRESRGEIELVLTPREKDLGEFVVRRVLPSGKRKLVGPFIFFDHMGPADFPPGAGVAVRPHPHIGLATVTYLFEGEIIHRDSLGVVQAIGPGAVNLMTAGRGIVHSERAGEDLSRSSRLHGIQTWMALPDHLQEIEPDFSHTPAAELPEIQQEGVNMRLIMGNAYGHSSPVPSHSPTLYMQVRLQAGAEMTLPSDYSERAVYVVEGAIICGGRRVEAGSMAVLTAEATILRSDVDAHVMLIGGEPVGDRFIWWNFVSDSKERIEQAKSDWRDQQFERIPGETEFIPLPEK